MNKQSDDKLDQQIKHFDSISNQYYTARQNHLFQCLKYHIWSEALKDILPEKIPSRPMVLEAMCGYADSYDILKKCSPLTSFEFHAFDYSQSMVKFAKKQNPEAIIWQQDITTYQADQYYDMVFLIGGLHHVHRHARQSLQNLAQALKPEGLLLSYEPTHNNILLRKIREYIYAKNALFDEDTERGFTTKELKRLFYKAQFKPVKQIFPGLLTYVLWYNPESFPMLNKGSTAMVDTIVNYEKKLWHSKIARYFSFSTLSVWKKNK